MFTLQLKREHLLNKTKIIITKNTSSGLLALFKNTWTLKFQTEVTTMFYAAINHYRNGNLQEDLKQAK